MMAGSIDTHPAIAVVACAKKFDQLRGLIHSVREQQRWTGELYVLDIGLTDAQVHVLRMARVRLVKVIQGSHDAVPMPQPFMWKIFAHNFVPAGDPLLVCDTDLEFRDPGVLAELFDLMRRQIVIAEEVFAWCSNVNVKYELDQTAKLRQAFLRPAYRLLDEGPIYNAGLFGGPRSELVTFLDLAQVLAASGLDVWHWFWEQIALSLLVKSGRFNVKVLDARHNWITCWGDNPAARIFHFSGEALANQLRTPVPGDYLRAVENAPRWQAAAGGGVEVLGR